MTEIKSTLDLIMERTRGMRLTDEEKEEIRRKELTGKIRGSVQKYADDLIGLEKLREEITPYQDTPEWKEILKRELCSRIALDLDNSTVILAARELLGIKEDDLNGKIRNARKDLKTLAKKLVNEMKQELAQDQISGTAVVPNLNGSEKWRQAVELLQKKLRESCFHSESR